MARSIKVRTGTSITVIEADETPMASELQTLEPIATETTVPAVAKTDRPRLGCKRLIGLALIMTVVATILYAIL